MLTSHSKELLFLYLPTDELHLAVNLVLSKNEDSRDFKVRCHFRSLSWKKELTLWRRCSTTGCISEIKQKGVLLPRYFKTVHSVNLDLHLYTETTSQKHWIPQRVWIGGFKCKWVKPRLQRTCWKRTQGKYFYECKIFQTAYWL